MVAGTWLAIISVVLAIGVVIAAPYIKKVTNCYFF
jgi:hypothetical protein